MHFLPDVYVTCDVCKGCRFNHETLDIRYKGKNIHEVLQMSIEQASGFFANVPQISRRLETLCSVGLGYICLGQSALTLSGGEAQRVKLSLELSRRSTGRTFYVLDEPTTGLHMEDVKKLVEVINKLIDLGNTMVIIEHNMDIIMQADHIIDLGPEGGVAGGDIVATGTPEVVMRQPRSHTGRFIAQFVAQKFIRAVAIGSCLLISVLSSIRAQQAPVSVPAASETEGLLRSTLSNDIGTSGFYELIAWLRQLGLATTGNRTELQQRLFAHYGIEASPETEASPDQVNIAIESALESQYFTIEEIDEQYIRLSGGVRLVLRDNDSSHTVVADQFLFNQTTSVITAKGNIRYALESNGETELFSGASLTLKLNSWDGLFVRGVAINSQSVENRGADIFHQWRRNHSFSR